MAADPSRLWNEPRGWAAPLGLPWRACNEAWAFSRDLGKIAGDLCLICGRTVAGSLTSPFRDAKFLSVVGSAMAFDQQLGRLGRGWPGADDGWGAMEDPLASDWDDVVRQPVVALPYPLFVQQDDPVVQQRTTTG